VRDQDRVDQERWAKKCYAVAQLHINSHQLRGYLPHSFIPSLCFQYFLVLRTAYSSHAQTSAHHIPLMNCLEPKFLLFSTLLPKHHAPNFRFPLYFDPDPLTHRKAPITPPNTLLATSPTTPAFSAIGG
jgi:hypothetical protein